MWYCWWLRRAPIRSLGSFTKQGHSRALLGTHVVEMTHDELVYETPLVHSRYRWQAIWKIEIVGELALLMTSHVTAIIVPRRGFATAEQWRRFVSTARSFHRDAPVYELRCPKCGYDLSALETHGCPECGWRRERATNEP